MKNLTKYGFVAALFFASTAQAAEGFFFKPAITVEYSAPDLSHGGGNDNFRTNNFGKQLNNLQNIALGANFRVHKNLGFNINWAQTELHSSKLQDAGTLSRKAFFNLNQYNFTTLLYAPVIDNSFELFGEFGVSDVTSKLTYSTADGTAFNHKAHETMAIYGGGFQVYLSEKNDSAIRFSVQRFSGKLALLDTNFTTVRIGYLKSF